MNFLDAHRIVSRFSGGEPLSFLLATSGVVEKLDVFVRAAAALQNRRASMKTLPFNTLSQAILEQGFGGDREVFVLFPWDFVPELDWRSGIPASGADADALRQRAEEVASRLRRRPNAKTIFIPAHLPPVFPSPSQDEALARWITALAATTGARILPASAFSLASYLAVGSPFASAHLGEIAAAIVDRALEGPVTPKKVLVTDLDGVMWHGVIGEDGVQGVRYSAEGIGFRHFIYQTFLRKLRTEGALLAAVSRNDPELAHAPFRQGNMLLREDDLVTIVASYSAKSAQIRQIASALNLGLDAFVFVDDNPVEIAEVSGAVPDVTTLAFPGHDDQLPEFLGALSRLFQRDVLTVEDQQRTDMYRRRLESLVPTDAKGSDLTAFLRGLDMRLTIRDRSQGERSRAVQLINKTNQFNLNGIRREDEQVAATLAHGGRLFTAELTDRTGSHGEILALLADADGVVRSFVLSCRVFQRRVEHAFLSWLVTQDAAPRAFDFAPTPRNEPIRQFLSDASFQQSATGLLAFDAVKYIAAHGDALELFGVTHAGVTVESR